VTKNPNKTVTKCSAPTLSVTALANNQLSGFGYDAAGNMTSNGGASYTYNSESQLITTAGVTYTYDGDGMRVKKSSGTLYWGAGPMLESDLSGNFQREYVFAGGARIARRDISTGNAYYFLSDRLGSSAVIANSAGAIQNEYDYLPYGEERDYLTTLANQNFKFIGRVAHPFGFSLTESPQTRVPHPSPVLGRVGYDAEPDRIGQFGRDGLLNLTGRTYFMPAVAGGGGQLLPQPPSQEELPPPQAACTNLRASMAAPGVAAPAGLVFIRSPLSDDCLGDCLFPDGQKYRDW